MVVVLILIALRFKCVFFFFSLPFKLTFMIVLKSPFSFPALHIFSHLLTAPPPPTSFFSFFLRHSLQVSSPEAAATTAGILSWRASDDKAEGRREKGKKKRARTSGDFSDLCGELRHTHCLIDFLPLFKPYLETPFVTWLLFPLLLFPPAFLEKGKIQQDILNFLASADFTYSMFTPA